ncbi:MAG: TetR/AcrR family transcriptional regulator [Phycisphaerales bacterium]|nr:MAG: TetR/AcrR family transcriptional regulator [Phycisphaerales bacterium]
MTESEVQRSLDARSAQDRLVEAAEVLFCERGFNETSVRDIAAVAGCNVASVNYYFGGKDNLYVEVWHRMLAAIREARLASIDGVMSAGGEPRLEDLLRSYANSFLSPLADGDHSCRFVHLMAREMIDPHLPQGMLIAEMIGPVMAALGDAVCEVSPDLQRPSARPIILSIVGQLVYTVCAIHLFENSADLELPPLDLNEMVEHIVTFSAAGIRGYGDRTGG